MSLGDDASAALPGLRVQAESLMTSACTISRAEPVWDPSTGEYVDSEPETVYTGRCKVRFVSSVVRESDVQGQLTTEQEPLLFLPVEGSESVTVGDVATVTANPFDAGMVGKRFRVAGIHTQTYATQRRLPLEAVT